MLLSLFKKIIIIIIIFRISHIFKKRGRPNFIKSLKNKFPSIPVDTYDERYTSKIAKDSIREMGKNKKFRQEKSNVDKISASIILQSYLTRKNI